MEPFTAILLVGIMTVAGVKTAGTAVNDGIASARGNTPPTHERWRANEEKRRARGEKPRKDPGGIKRIWSNQMEYAAEKSAYKHQGRMEYLADHGDDIATGKRVRMERGDRRRQAVGGALASAGGSSWDAMKTAAQKAADAKRNHAERKTEQAAWRENDRRDEDTAGWVDEDGRGHPRRYSSENGSGWELPVVYGEDGNPYCVHPDGSWSPYEPAPIEAEDAVADATVLPFHRQSTSEQYDIVRRWRAALVAGADRTEVLSAEEWNSLPSLLCDQLIREAQAAGVLPTVTKPDGEKRTLQPDQDTDTARGGGHRGSSTGGWATGPQSGPPLSAQGEHGVFRDSSQHFTPTTRAQKWAEREQERERLDHAFDGYFSEAHPEDEPDTEPANTDTSNTGDTAMSSHSGEITNLSSALEYVTSASEYCDQLDGKFENSLSQAHTTADEIGDEAGGLETAISSLTGFDLHNEAGRLSAVQERYNEIVQAMQDVETAVTAAREAIDSAKQELDNSAEEFQSQSGISEQASSHDEVASDMNFYVDA